MIITVIESQIIACLLILFRVGAFIAFLPPLNGQGMPATVKIGLAISLVAVIAPQHAVQIAISSAGDFSSAGAWLHLAWLVIRETALGAALAWLFSLCFVPVRVAGAWVAQEMGLTMAGLASPMDQQSSNVISQVLEAIAVLLFFVMDLHHIMFWMIGRSFVVRPAASGWEMPSWETVLWSVTQSVDQGFVIIGPVGVLLFVVSLTVLITMRTAPQFNFMSYGMTMRLVAGIGGLILFFPDICGAVQGLLLFVGQEAT
jgi:flagellar biosynthetic protein FliR